ncbi:MAG: type II toxin-antitoxin system VapC family toxin [Candidatus Gracilibacteria bacterium]
MGRRKGVILDTHIFVKYVLGHNKMLIGLKKLIDSDTEKYISAFSIWEIGMLVSKKRINLSLKIDIWVAKALEGTGISVINLDPSIALKSTSLKGDFHGDPADRIIVATAIEKKLLLLTEDKQILAYAKKGYVKAKSI